MEKKRERKEQWSQINLSFKVVALASNHNPRAFSKRETERRMFMSYRVFLTIQSAPFVFRHRQEKKEGKKREKRKKGRNKRLTVKNEVDHSIDPASSNESTLEESLF